MNKANSTPLAIVIIVGFAFLVGGVVYAQCPTEGLVPCGTEGCPCTLCHFFEMLDKIIDLLLLRIVPVLGALMIAIGGAMYIISLANPEKLSRVKRLFAAVAIGLIIIYGAWATVNIFLTTIGVADWTGLKTWWQISCSTSPGKDIFGLLNDDILETLRKNPEIPCDIFHCSLFDTNSLHILATKQVPGTKTFIAQSETKHIEQAAKEGKDVFTSKQQKKINKADISILHNEDFIAKHNEHIDKDLKEGCIDQEKADFLKKNASYVTAATDRDGNIMVNKEKLEAIGMKRASGTFAHEYAHVVDGTEFQFSHSNEWKKIYSSSVGYKFEYKEKRLKEVIEWQEKGGELSPAIKSPGFVSDYAYYGGEHEDFAETVRVYRKTGGDPNQVTNDTKSQKLIKQRFDYLEKEKIVNPEFKTKEKSSILLDINLGFLDLIPITQNE